MIWFTEVEIPTFYDKIDLNDKIMMIGSCFANEIGANMIDSGFDACVNPYGTMYNPASVIESLNRIAYNIRIEEKDVLNISLHSTSGDSDNSNDNARFCSFYHHSSLSRGTIEEYIYNANSITELAHKHFNESKFIIITLGTSWVYRHINNGYIVSNCHKINPKEFVREKLNIEKVYKLLADFIKSFPDKHFIFTVSPIRHLKDSAHGNQISKAILLLTLEQIISEFNNTYYFPSYEIMLDELRDYRFYAADMVHPSKQTIDYIYKRFKECCISTNCHDLISRNIKSANSRKHISLNKKAAQV